MQNERDAKIIEFQIFKRKKEWLKRESQFIDLDVKELLAESQKLLKALELSPLNEEIGKRSQQLIREIMHRLGDIDDQYCFEDSQYEAVEKFNAIQPYL